MMEEDLDPTFRISTMSAYVSHIPRFLARSGHDHCLWRGANQLVRPGTILALGILISGCVTPVVSHIAPAEAWVAETSHVLLMPADARIHIMTTGGVPQERADWTQQSRSNLMTALREELSGREVVIVPYREFGTTIPWDPDHAPMIRLYDVVGDSILGAAQLPTKRLLRDETGDLDYSLGDTVLELGDSYSADYALLLHVNASYASAGRAVVAVIAAVGGVSLQTNAQTAFASLVDLRDGKIIWFGTTDGVYVDTREQHGAQTLVEGILAELPL